jgi:hypothetical protein
MTYEIYGLLNMVSVPSVNRKSPNKRAGIATTLFGGFTADMMERKTGFCYIQTVIVKSITEV